MEQLRKAISLLGELENSQIQRQVLHLLQSACDELTTLRTDTSASLETSIQTQALGDLFRIYLVKWHAKVNQIEDPIEFVKAAGLAFDKLGQTAIAFNLLGMARLAAEEAGEPLPTVESVEEQRKKLLGED